MLNIAIFIVIFITIYKLNGSIKENKNGYLNHGISSKDYKKLIITLWFYVFPVLIIAFPIKYFIYFIYPIPFLILFFIPGIRAGKKIGKSLSTSGIDVGVKAGRVADNVMSLGIGALLLVLGIWAFGYFNLYLEHSL